MKKCGIVTFYNHNNFGAMLQAYALKKVIESYDVDVDFISFQEESTKEEDTSNLHPLIKRIKDETDKRNRRFEDFRKKWLPGNLIHEGIEEEYDFFVAGSDQIWNTEIVGDDSRYFLSFAPKEKKRSYAVSFGKDSLSVDEVSYCKEMIYDFTPWLSVREQSGAEIIKDITGKDSLVCLDPTLLTKMEEWDELRNSSDFNQNPAKYILLITVQNDLSLLKVARQMAEERNEELRIITASYFPPVGFESWSEVEVVDWVNLVANSSYVITSSFHGIAFSIIFHKDFSFWPLQAELSGRNTRMIELLEYLSLSDRMGKDCGHIDWNKVEEKRQKMIDNSMSYIKKMVE